MGPPETPPSPRFPRGTRVARKGLSPTSSGSGVVDLQVAINHGVDDHRQGPKPLVSTADLDKAIAEGTRPGGEPLRWINGGDARLGHGSGGLDPLQ